MNYQIKAESGQKLLARLSCRPSLCGLDVRLFGTEGPLSRDVIEITGEASVGKSMLVLQWIARAILSPPRGGLGKTLYLLRLFPTQKFLIIAHFTFVLYCQLYFYFLFVYRSRSFTNWHRSSPTSCHSSSPHWGSYERIYNSSTNIFSTQVEFKSSRDLH